MAIDLVRVDLVAIDLVRIDLVTPSLIHTTGRSFLNVAPLLAAVP